ncbi:ABC transporter permease [Microbacterium amylolyticum]|uniref:ABC-type nitrate/sulfonate/bicarbonate transport system permease component n=1 Tax=Microbacterium amylolyticum TaxID=936337 RepID=A0ABS4ZGQ8_9MICO|nr:ABC transporter permease subunit [Microbacterium amylolyticum]MBP2436462.1 ABC-type nitrate/sulfonate/bicarbonate transport system permease component [Microbacterium amylolyticum]
MTALQTTTSPPTAEPSSDIRREARRATIRALGTSLSTFGLTIAAVIVLWQGLLWVFGISAYVGKGPLDVWAFLVTDDAAAENRARMFGELFVTLGDAAIGFAAGLFVALLVALAFQLSKGIEHALMPLAMLLRSVPLVAMAPVIILIFGRTPATVAVMGGIVVLFPALVNIVFGLRQASPQMNDLIAVYGGSAWTALRKVALPSSLPSLLAAVRISVPGAITGALLAEWLAVGGGVGGAVGGYSASAQFTALWTSVVLVTIAALVLYNLVAIIESVVLARMGMADRA